MQPRYFLPVVPCLMLAVSRLFGGWFRFGAADAPDGARRRDVTSVYLCAGVSLVAACELLLLYYLT